MSSAGGGGGAGGGAAPTSWGASSWGSGLCLGSVCPWKSGLRKSEAVLGVPVPRSTANSAEFLTPEKHSH